MKTILLNKGQADKVRGKYGEYSALEPVESNNGLFILPIAVLDHPEFASILNELKKCKFGEIEKLKSIDDSSDIKELTVKKISPIDINIEKDLKEKPIYQEYKNKYARVS